MAGRKLPLVVSVSSSSPSMVRSIRHSVTTPGRSSGSPPVRRIFFTPQRTAASAISANSSRLRISLWAFLHTPSSPMQYTQR